MNNTESKIQTITQPFIDMKDIKQLSFKEWIRQNREERFAECSECEGIRKLECDKCGGTGECECLSCDNNHDCGDCNGKGTFDCEYCDGRGDNALIQYKAQYEVDQKRYLEIFQ